MHHREELHELLLCAGLTVVEDVRPGSLFPPEAGWRIARGIPAPDGAAREALDAAWWCRLADADGEFLVAVLGHRIGGNDSWWTRVRYADGGVPGLTGDPGFVALSPDGQVLLSEVPSVEGPRVTALDRLPERLDEAAAAAGSETEAERAEVWAAVPGRPAWPLHWAEGIGFNPAAPDELLIRLLDVEVGFLHGCDRPAVLDAAVSHTDPRVRSRPADTFRPKLTSDQWVRLIRAEPSPGRRVPWAENACAWGVELPGDLYDDLLAGPARAQAAELPGLPAHHLPGLAADADPRVRATACARWEDLAAPLRARLLADTDGAVRTAALLAHHTRVPMPREVFAALPAPRRALDQCRLSPVLEAELVRDGDAEVRRALAANPRLSAHSVAVLAEDPCDDIRSAVALRPDLDEEKRAAVRYDFDVTPMSRTLPWVEGLHGDADAMRRLAVSSHPLIRRAWPVPGIFHRTSWSVWRGTRTARSASSWPNRARTRRPRCCWRSGAGGTEASLTPTAPAATPTFLVRACCATSATPVGGCAAWPWTIRSPCLPTSQVSPATQKPRCAAEQPRTPGCHRPTRCGC
ncbi:hypothetical protein [Streptomyces sp. NBC_00887]|uniref:hypothetical protein n=1 Tax=Streptomyces sp. NBC_00887 TaxID=2975859 RepID=UPI00386B6CB1|nr:hypothetical protein OG844_47030 [Streptomyces sp. NBC_00887]